MKKIILAIALSTTLAIQAAPVAQKYAPMAAEQMAQRSQTETAKLVSKTESRVVAYYDKDGEETQTESKGGFYRMLLGYTADGRAVVQDFYQDTRTKQIDPVVMSKDSDVKDFSVYASEGRTTWYTPEGELKNYVVIEKGKILEQGYYRDGKLRLLAHELMGQNKEAWGYYSNGQLFMYAKQKANETEPHILMYGKNGNILIDSQKPLDGEPVEEAVEAAKIYFDLMMEFDLY
ncbi:hypothetical protein [Wielerella bovis]|uniref:hypothetical protein n=1 Tax=Wielerella bovis TaxID=2917790 RepID=UPI002018B2C9|nr:hypothetical protein [Wielerella bovis]MCG7656926.1 hypothetical protein [Wielerella bovis]MCG7659149.1 hypothetical protein [Wielerella bovis]